jgi:hypothetical protein
MIVRCLSNRDCDLPEASYEFQEGGSGKSTSGEEVTFDLVIGKEYVVYAIDTWEDRFLRYVLCGEHYSYYPRLYPSPLFEVIDGRIPSCWIYGVQRNEAKGNFSPTFGFKEWVDEAGFYYWLTERAEVQVAVWERYKLLIEDEAGWLR